MESGFQERLEQVETKIAFQEQSLQELGDTVYQQALRIERLETVIKMLTDRIAELAEAMPDTTADDEVPPHY
ncbi:MAG: hypothetical protein AMJ59_03480 [Gammaproteobacteria bacterium SG8_31]|jgi:SlyX protein|nr:MAG: hypothetical protein AMJ59_03480 [Gammaproteobacteria bacterium SG8_31]